MTTRSNREVAERIQAGYRAAADEAYQRLYRLCPVDTGKLRNSIRVKIVSGKVVINMLFYGFILNVRGSQKGWIDRAIKGIDARLLAFSQKGGGKALTSSSRPNAARVRGNQKPAASGRRGGRTPRRRS